MDPSMEHMELEDIVLTAFCKVTSDDCQNWIGHCKIYNHCEMIQIIVHY